MRRPTTIDNKPSNNSATQKEYKLYATTNATFEHLFNIEEGGAGALLQVDLFVQFVL